MLSLIFSDKRKESMMTEKLKYSFQVLMAFILFFYFEAANALVDYSEPEFQGKNKSFKKRTPKGQKAAPKTSTTPYLFEDKAISLELGYQSVSVKDDSSNGAADILYLKGHFQTLYNFFLDFSYFQGQSSDELIAKSSESQKGNLEFLLGLNWLHFGDSANKATIDIEGGIMFPEKESEFGSSRLDKILGVITAKRFGNIAVSLGMRLRAVGVPKNEAEAQIGNVLTYSSELGVYISPDIQFVLEGKMINIAPATDLNRDGSLQEDQKFAYLSPKLHLGLTSNVVMNLGASFQTRKIKETQILKTARLWNIE